MDDKWLAAIERLGISTVLLFIVGIVLWKKIFPIIQDQYEFLQLLIERHEAREIANQQAFLSALDKQGEKFERGMTAFNEGLKVLGEIQRGRRS